MSYFYDQCINANSEQIREAIQRYTKQYEIAKENRNEAIRNKDDQTASKYDKEIRPLEIALDRLSKDLENKQKEEANGTKPKIKESIEYKKKQIQDLIERLSDIIKTL